MLEVFTSEEFFMMFASPSLIMWIPLLLLFISSTRAAEVCNSPNYAGPLVLPFKNVSFVDGKPEVTRLGIFAEVAGLKFSFEPNGYDSNDLYRLPFRPSR